MIDDWLFYLFPQGLQAPRNAAMREEHWCSLIFSSISWNWRNLLTYGKRGTETQLPAQLAVCLLSMISFAAVLAYFARVFTTVFFFSRQASVIYAGYGRVFYCICNASALKNCHSSFMLDYDFDCRCLMVLFTDQYLTESLSKPTWKHFIWQKMKWKDGYESIRWFSEWFSSILV